MWMHLIHSKRPPAPTYSSSGLYICTCRFSARKQTRSYPFSFPSMSQHPSSSSSSQRLPPSTAKPQNSSQRQCTLQSISIRRVSARLICCPFPIASSLSSSKMIQPSSTEVDSKARTGTTPPFLVFGVEEDCADCRRLSKVS